MSSGFSHTSIDIPQIPFRPNQCPKCTSYVNKKCKAYSKRTQLPFVGSPETTLWPVFSGSSGDPCPQFSGAVGANRKWWHFGFLDRRPTIKKSIARLAVLYKRATHELRSGAMTTQQLRDMTDGIMAAKVYCEKCARQSVLREVTRLVTTDTAFTGKAVCPSCKNSNQFSVSMPDA